MKLKAEGPRARPLLMGWGDNKINLKIWCGLISMAQNMDQWQALMSKITNLQLL